jgi:hypothetical protein
MKVIRVPRGGIDPLVRPKQWKRDLRFGTWHVRSLYRSGSFTAIARELARNELDLVGVLKLGGTKGEQYEQGLYFFTIEKENKVINRERSS